MKIVEGLYSLLRDNDEYFAMTKICHSQPRWIEGKLDWESRNGGNWIPVQLKMVNDTSLRGGMKGRRSKLKE